MQAEEIRKRVDLFRENAKLAVSHIEEQIPITIEAVRTRIEAEQAVYLGEIAAQLADLNSKFSIHTSLSHGGGYPEGM